MKAEKAMKAKKDEKPAASVGDLAASTRGAKLDDEEPNGQIFPWAPRGGWVRIGTKTWAREGRYWTFIQVRHSLAAGQTEKKEDEDEKPKKSMKTKKAMKAKKDEEPKKPMKTKRAYNDHSTVQKH